MNYVYIPRQLTQQFQAFEFSAEAEDITSDYKFQLPVVDALTIGTDEYYPMCYKVTDLKTFKNLLKTANFTATPTKKHISGSELIFQQGFVKKKWSVKCSWGLEKV